MESAFKALFTKRIAGLPMWKHLVIAFGLLFLIGGGIYGVVVNSDAYGIANTFASSHPKVVGELGSPVSARLGFGRLSVKLSEPYSSMRFPLVVSGSKADGVVSVEMSKRQDGKWIIQRAVLSSPTGQVELTNLSGG